MKKHIFASALGIVFLAAASLAAAATIHGTLVNGTTGKPIDGVVKVVNPGSGMMDETEVQASGGSFTVEGLDASAGIYLLRSDYGGVMYTEVVRFDGGETAHATVTVYEPLASFEGIHVLVPHLAVAAVEDHLQIEVMYELHNHVEPAGTVTGKENQFLIYLPEDRIEILRSFVTYGEIPLDLFPVPTDEPGIYRVDYPIRPGDTQFGIAYSVPYRDSTYTLKYESKYGIETMNVYAVNPGMTVTSGTLDLGHGTDVHGMTAFEIHDVKAGSTFELTFRGGGEIDMAAAGEEDPHGGSTAGSSVITAPNRMENPSTLLMVVILLAMLAMVGVATRGGSNPHLERERLETFHKTLLKQLARLDDLNEAGAVAHDVYKVKRAELKNQIASVMYQLQSGGKKGKSGKKARAHAHGVAGNERTAP